MPHDSTPAEPVLLSLSMPTRPARLVDDLVRPISDPPPAPVLDLDISDESIAEFLVGIAHTDSGFIARTADGNRAVAIVAATAAALCGEDIRTALTNPDLPFLRTLQPPAIEALRTVLLAIETPAPATITRALTTLTSD